MSAVKSRWADDAADEARRKREKGEKKRLRAEKQRKQAEEELSRKQAAQEAAARDEDGNDISDRPAKRQRLSQIVEADRQESAEGQSRPLLRFAAPEWGPCRHISNFETLNHIEEGSYGWVSRAKELATGEVVALKKLKMDNTASDGFPVTALREIQTLQASRHNHIVDLREVIMGNGLDEVYIVMDFVEHDLKTLEEIMAEPFLPSEVKTLMGQLCSAVAFLHSHWILHRDLKTSNILMNNRGEIKLADFGMARHTGDPPPPNLTQLVVTLWYRAPELLLGTKTYGFEIDMWSVGCIFGEILQKEPLLQGKNEVDQVSKIFALTGLPTESNWPSFRRLPNSRTLRLPSNPPPHMTKSNVRRTFPFLTNAGVDLLNSLLSLNPESRPTADEALGHPYFREDPRPKAKEMFPTYPSKANQERRRRIRTPSAPKRGEGNGKVDLGGLDLSSLFTGESEEGGGGFQLKMG